MEEGRKTVRTVALGATCSRQAQKHVTDTLGVHFTLQWPLRVRQAPRASLQVRHLSSAGQRSLPPSPACHCWLSDFLCLLEGPSTVGTQKYPHGRPGMDGLSTPPLTCRRKPGVGFSAVRWALNKIRPALGLGLEEP